EEEKSESPEHLPAVRELKSWGAQIVLPVGRPEQLQGLVLLGPQKSGGSYGPSVLEFLGLLANQASVSLENARLLEAERTRERIIQQESLAAVAQLVDGTAHELNNPLGSAHSLVATAIESIDEARNAPAGNGALPLEEAKQALLFAQQQHARARQIIQTLRQLSELSAQPREAIPLAKILEDAVRAIRLKHSALPFEGDLLVPPEMAPYPGSFAQISQMFLHVLDNAVRSLGGAQGKIKATLTDEKGEVVFRCEDTGCGIAPEHLKNVFRPFYSGWRPQRDCRGLGLYVCHEIAKTHGGRIDIESTLGKGTTITVRLPRG
ncbi:MAG: ATP-binding protein, partial [Bdellovibrionota bacterium]